MFAFGGQVGERHQRNGLPAPLKRCEPAVEESSKPRQPELENRPTPPPLGGGVSSFWREKPNSPLCGDFWLVRGRGRETTPPKQQTRPVGPAVTSSCHRQLPREALGYEVSVFSCGKAPGFSAGKLQQTQDRRYPAPPPKGGGVSSFWREKTNSHLCGPVCGFGGRVGKQHQQSPRPALLEPCEAVAKGNCLEKPSDTKHPSFPAEKHWASLY